MYIVDIVQCILICIALNEVCQYFPIKELYWFQYQLFSSCGPEFWKQAAIFELLKF